MKNYLNPIKALISIIAIITLFNLVNFKDFFALFKVTENKIGLIFVIIPILILIFFQSFKIVNIYRLFKFINIKKIEIIKIQSKVNLFAEVSSLFMIGSRLIFDKEKGIPLKSSLYISFFDKSFSLLARLIFLIPSIVFFLHLLNIKIYSIVLTILIILILLIFIVYFYRNNLLNLNLNKKYLLNISIFSLIMQILMLLIMGLIFILILSNENLLFFLLLIPLIITIQEIPITVTSFGYRELIFIFSLDLISITALESLFISLSYGILKFASVFIFYLIIKFKIINF